MWSHLDKNNLSNPYQSAYKPIYSTETLLKFTMTSVGTLTATRPQHWPCLNWPQSLTPGWDHSTIIELLSGWYGIPITALNCVIAKGWLNF